MSESYKTDDAIREYRASRKMKEMKEDFEILDSVIDDVMEDEEYQNVLDSKTLNKIKGK